MSKNLIVSLALTVIVILIVYIFPMHIDYFILTLWVFLWILYLYFQRRRIVYLYRNLSILMTDLLVWLILCLFASIAYYVSSLAAIKYALYDVPICIGFFDIHDALMDYSILMFFFWYIVFLFIMITLLPEWKKKKNLPLKG